MKLILSILLVKGTETQVSGLPKLQSKKKKKKAINPVPTVTGVCSDVLSSSAGRVVDIGYI